MMQTDDAHSPRELWFDGKAIDIKGCISTEGRRMWENLRQRPVDLLLRTRTPQFFPRNPPGIPAIKERVLSEIESDCRRKRSLAPVTGSCRGILLAYKGRWV